MIYTFSVMEFEIITVFVKATAIVRRYNVCV